MDKKHLELIVGKSVHHEACTLLSHGAYYSPLALWLVAECAHHGLLLMAFVVCAIAQKGATNRNTTFRFSDNPMRCSIETPFKPGEETRRFVFAIHRIVHDEQTFSIIRATYISLTGAKSSALFSTNSAKGGRND